MNKSEIAELRDQFTRAEGDTRELKAALTNLVARLKIVMAWPEPHFSHDLPIEIRAELAEAEKLLG